MDPARRPAPVWATLHGATGRARSLLQPGLSMGSQPPLGHIRLLWRGVLHRLQGDSVLHWGPPWGQTCVTTFCTMGCRGISPSSPSFFTQLGVCRVVSLAYSHPSLPAALTQQILALLKDVVPEALITLHHGGCITVEPGECLQGL